MLYGKVKTNLRTERNRPQKVPFTPPEIPSPTSCPETAKILRSGRIIRRPGGGAGVEVVPHSRTMRQRSRDGLKLHTAPSRNAAREQIHCLIWILQAIQSLVQAKPVLVLSVLSTQPVRNVTSVTASRQTIALLHSVTCGLRHQSNKYTSSFTCNRQFFT
ncbi:hypothetical protein EVAR_94638_1 [Eumeta japonica]|uniref:Uncharacterized protein n=1 Tax=Eumeta variegata TaxID=151549 RepID=A0A4C1UTN5_EUMVA|nr:hypothetical protein EVAR_94638_1 [Eumeta japonica]